MVLMSSALAGGFFTTSTTWEALALLAYSQGGRGQSHTPLKDTEGSPVLPGRMNIGSPSNWGAESSVSEEPRFMPTPPQPVVKLQKNQPTC